MGAFVVSQSSYCHLFGCFMTGRWIRKYTKLTREFWESHTKIVVHISKNYWRKQTVPIHHKNLQLLATEIFKAQKNPNPTLVNKVFEEKDTLYIRRSGKNILVTKPSTRCGIENARFLGAKVWRIIPSSLTESQTLKSFKKGIKNHQFDCNCRFCKRFVEHFGLLWLQIYFWW